MTDLAQRDGVIALMLSSKSEQEWNSNCDKVKTANGGNYPGWWFETIILSGILGKVKTKWVEAETEPQK